MTADRSEELSLRRFWAPRYWPMWLLLGALYGAARLPYAWHGPIGRALGRALALVRRRERTVAARNLAICFPELDARARAGLLNDHFEAIGRSFLEMAMGWCWPIERLLAVVRVEGREHLDRALAQNRGIILLGAHFTTLEIANAMLEALCPRPRCSGMYRPQRNAMMDIVIRRGRRRFASEQIPRDDVRKLLKHLRAKYVVLYLPDQTYLGRQSELLPFFGEPALTNVATSKLAKISDAIVLTYFSRRLPGNQGYVLDIGAPLEDFPTDDAAADTRRLVARLEDYIRLAPEQYLWLYKKFKNRPAPHPDPYCSAHERDVHA